MTQHYRKDTLGKSVSILNNTTDTFFDILSAMAMCEANGRLLHMFTECVNELLGLAQKSTSNPPNQHDMFASALPLTVDSVLTNSYLARSRGSQHPINIDSADL